MSETPESLADRLIQEGSRVVDFFNSLSPEQWEIQVYPEQGDWTFTDLLAHFVSAEIGRYELVENIISGGEGAPPNFNIDRFNLEEVKRLSERTSEVLLKDFSFERQNFADLVRRLPASSLDLIGNDPFLGEVPITEIIKLTYRHLQIHMREVRRLLQ